MFFFLLCQRVWKTVKSQGKIREKSGNFEVDCKSGGAQLSRDIQNEPCYTSITLFCLKEIEFK